MRNRNAIARKAIADALSIRLGAERGLDKAICVYDLAWSLGVEVRFLDIPSMEGMYYKSPDPTSFSHLYALRGAALSLVPTNSRITAGETAYTWTNSLSSGNVPGDLILKNLLLIASRVLY